MRLSDDQRIATEYHDARWPCFATKAIGKSDQITLGIRLRCRDDLLKAQHLILGIYRALRSINEPC